MGDFRGYISHVEVSSSAANISSRDATCISVIQVSAYCGLISASSLTLGSGKTQASTFENVVRVITVIECPNHGEVPKPSGVAHKCYNCRRSV
jgi:hypothetical protein